MNLYIQIIVTLFIIIFVQMFVHIYVIRRLKFNQGNEVKEGIKLGEKIPNFSYENMKGEVNQINKSFFNEGKMFIFVDVNCSECQMLIDSLNVYKKNYTRDMRLIIKKSAESHTMIHSEIESMFLDERVIEKQFNITSFPFLIKVNSKATVEEKGFFTKNHVIDYLVTPPPVLKAH